MRILLLVYICISYSLTAHSFNVPKNFEKSNSYGNIVSFWIHPKTLETVSITNEDYSKYKRSPAALKELKKFSKAKAWTMSQILNVKKWKIERSLSKKRKNGDETVFLFGSYIDSSKELVKFAEVYSMPKKGKAKAYLFTRAKKAWHEKELSKRFGIKTN